jgi:hypothetical protein
LLLICLQAALPPILFIHHFKIGTFPVKTCLQMLGRHGGDERVVISKGEGQWGGQATIMMCGCDGGWDGGDGSLKSVNGSGP